MLVNVIEVVNKLMLQLDLYLNRLHLLSSQDLVKNLQDRNSNVQFRRQAGEDNGKSVEDRFMQFGERLSAIFKKDDFGPSGGLSKKLKDFKYEMESALTNYGQTVKDNPTTTFENNTRRAAFGADSLAAIGAGGNVYGGLSVLDVAKSQLRVLESIDGKLSAQRNYGLSEVQAAPSPTIKVSRVQTSSPLNN